jgi:hypothetical protein
MLNKRAILTKHMNKINQYVNTKIKIKCLNDVNNKFPKIKKFLNVLKSLNKKLQMFLREKYVFTLISQTIKKFIGLINEILFNMQDLLEIWDMFVIDDLNYDIKRIPSFAEVLEIQLENVQL